MRTLRKLAATEPMWRDGCYDRVKAEGLAAVVAVVVVPAGDALLNNELDEEPEGDDNYRDEGRVHFNLLREGSDVRRTAARRVARSEASCHRDVVYGGFLVRPSQARGYPRFVS